MKNWEQGYLNSDAAVLHYFRSGGELPPLVLVHGFTDNAIYFSRVADALSTSWDVIAYDARGHGQSDRVVDRFDDETRVQDLVAVVRELGLDRPAMIGHSMGAATIVHALAVTPGLSRAAVLEDPAWSEVTDAEIEARDALRAQVLTDWKAWVTALQSTPRPQAFAQRLAEEPTWSPIDVEMALDGRLEFQLDLFDHFPMKRSPWHALIPPIDCPVLLMIGGNKERGAIVTRDDAVRAHRLNPLVEWSEISAAGHHLKYDCFDLFMLRTIEFLDWFH